MEKTLMKPGMGKNKTSNSGSGSILLAILFVAMMLGVYLILVRNALYRMNVVVQDIPVEYTRSFAELEIMHIRNGIWLLLVFGLIGWGAYLLQSLTRKFGHE